MEEIFEQLLEKIRQYDKIIIHRHVRPDLDAIGSQVGLQNLLLLNFPEKKVLVTGYDEPNLHWLAGMNYVSDQDYQDALVIVCDTANRERIDDQRYQNGRELIKIDHHPNDTPYGDISWVDPQASSTSEMITRFSREANLLMDVQTARLLYAGIVGDTGRFLFPSTTTITFEMAAYLRQFPIDFSSLSREMDTISLAIAKLQGFVYDNLEMDENGAARVLITQKDLNRFGLKESDSSAIVGAPGRIKNVKAWGVFVEQEDGSYRVRLRSKTIPINDIAKNHSGGGHPLASGANSASSTENDQIYQEIQDLLKKTEK
ncbi:bifunctional oligoribonuclease/PAP phosphatase NrnA [Streptococcus sp. NLN76]|uniref:DHH family phosphoesterase n=1 Tax=Streptococcus sp. NLN76 TaxID=2822800 RepID=UPI0018AC886B|nr:bifunctional oligoribonuclease/PAP phosphatase NrnA [Streptococcus sp. NLN76]MBF8970628.1 bifunctional oligoribonuclease/PAP phosphatase NrnA [Streptococcus sp. NLN76]